MRVRMQSIFSNVELVSDPIARIVPDGIVTNTGQHIAVDVIVWATGFNPLARTFPVLGRLSAGPSSASRAVHPPNLSDRLTQDPRAYYGMSWVDFPNFFTMLGPNTLLGHTSMVFMSECQANYIVDCLKTARRLNVSSWDIKPEVLDAFSGVRLM
jgi:cation diffusion facilitator CzcD-associated flavoprotein CzcO